MEDQLLVDPERMAVLHDVRNILQEIPSEDGWNFPINVPKLRDLVRALEKRLASTVLPPDDPPS